MTQRANLRYMDSSLHMVLWGTTFVLAIIVLGMPIALLHDLLRHDRITWHIAVIFVLSVFALLGLRTWWRQYWFLPVDLRQLVTKHTGTDFDQRSSLGGTLIRARFGTLWMLAMLNRPILDVLPTWPTYEFQRKLALGIPEFMLEGARVGLVQLGDFARLPQLDVRVVGRQQIEPAHTGNDSLDHAIRNAASLLQDEDVAIRVEIRPRWLQVEVDGGVWLGSRFTQKIEHALTFSQRLVEELAGLFTPMQPAEWTVDQEYMRVRRSLFVGSLERRLHVMTVPKSNKQRVKGSE